MNTITRRTALAAPVTLPLLPVSAYAGANATDAAWSAYEAARARYDADKAARDAAEAATGIGHPHLQIRTPCASQDLRDQRECCS